MHTYHLFPDQIYEDVLGWRAFKELQGISQNSEFQVSAIITACTCVQTLGPPGSGLNSQGGLLIKGNTTVWREFSPLLC